MKIIDFSINWAEDYKLLQLQYLLKVAADNVTVTLVVPPPRICAIGGFLPQQLLDLSSCRVKDKNVNA